MLIEGSRQPERHSGSSARNPPSDRLLKDVDINLAVDWIEVARNVRPPARS